MLTNFGRTVSLTEKMARRLPAPADVLELDVNDEAQIATVRDELQGRWGTLDGFLHAIAFAPQDALGGNFLQTPWESVATAIQTSAYSPEGARGRDAAADGATGRLRRLARLRRDRWRGRSTTGWASRRPALESVTRYLARDLGPKGIRVNTVSAGPIRTMAGKGIPGFDAHHRRVGRPCAARLGRHRPATGRRHGRVPVLGPVARASRGETDPRGRRVPRDGDLTWR